MSFHLPGWNRAAGDEPPADTFDGWGPGVDPRTGQPLERPHLRHWAEGTTFADGSKPERCWCQTDPKAAEMARRDAAEQALAEHRASRKPQEPRQTPGQLPAATPRPKPAPRPSQALTRPNAEAGLRALIRRMRAELEDDHDP